jgi:hypothetical protein
MPRIYPATARRQIVGRLRLGEAVAAIASYATGLVAAPGRGLRNRATRSLATPQVGAATGNLNQSLTDVAVRHYGVGTATGFASFDWNHLDDRPSAHAFENHSVAGLRALPHPD